MQAGQFDLPYTRSWLAEMLGEDAPGVQRILTLSGAAETWRSAKGFDR